MLRLPTALLVAALAATASAQPAGPAPGGLVVLESDAGFEETYARLRRAVEAHPALSVLAEFDHAANAERAGLSLRPTRVLVFGNPQVGTPLMEAAPTLAIDLPQKVLVWEEAGTTSVAYTDPAYLAERHGLSVERERLGRISRALSDLAAAATGRE
ncbi:MAG: DUF302 domain-containing protein [Rhodothermales bacterium]|nr:DUF302 domain-containing protein [Rhodothermales bacterium]